MSQEGQYIVDNFIQTIEGNTGGPVPPDASGNIFIVGDNPQGIDINGNPAANTLTVTAFDATESQKGVVLLATDAEAIDGTVSTNSAIIPTSLKAKLGAQTINGMAYGAGDNQPLQWTSAGTDGQLIIAATGLPPTFADLTSTGGTIDINPGPNTLNIDVDETVAINFDTDAGTATPIANTLQVLGGTNIATAGATNIVTINIDGIIDISNGGTATNSIPANGQLLIGNGTNYTVANLTEGANVSILNAAGSIIISANTGGQTVNVTTIDDTDSPYTVLDTDYYISANSTLGIISVLLPNAPSTGRVVVVKDSAGASFTNNISVTTVGGVVTIDGLTTQTIATNFQALHFLFNGSTWEVF